MRWSYLLTTLGITLLAGTGMIVLNWALWQYFIALILLWTLDIAIESWWKSYKDGDSK